MLKGILGTTAIILFLCPVSGLAEIKSPEMSIMCRNQKEVRTLRVEKLKDGSCQSIYTKAGKDQNIGSGLNQESCEGFLHKVRLVLEEADWKCREVKESRVSNLVEPRSEAN